MHLSKDARITIEEVISSGADVKGELEESCDEDDEFAIYNTAVRLLVKRIKYLMSNFLYGARVIRNPHSTNLDYVTQIKKS